MTSLRASNRAKAKSDLTYYTKVRSFYWKEVLCWPPAESYFERGAHCLLVESCDVLIGFLCLERFSKGHIECGLSSVFSVGYLDLGHRVYIDAEPHWPRIG